VLDRTLVREGEGLLADMMADPDLPRHLLSGLRAVSGLLKSGDVPLLDAASSLHRVKTSPIASLSDCSFTTADYANLPYAERPIYLPKVCVMSRLLYTPGVRRQIRALLRSFFSCGRIVVRKSTLLCPAP